MRLSGTSRWVGGGNGLCALGQRFVVDGTPTGEPTWGNAIMVQNGATRIHEAFGTELALPLGAGAHTVSVEIANGNGFGTCNLDGDGGAMYDRSQLLVSAHDPKDAWYAESNADTGPLALGPWTDIPGVSTVFALEASKHVQVSLGGTQYSSGTGVAHCAYRFVVDGAPLGNPSHGQAIAVGDVVSGWWAPVSLKYGLDMAAGPHSITAQISNSGATGGACSAGVGNSPYARFRMFVTSSPKGGLTTTAESFGGAYIFAPNSPWTAIGGLGTTFNVPSAGQVQFELAATLRTTSGLGQCAWRYVLDGVALGDPNFGLAINIGDANSWWTTSSVLWGQAVTAGSHTVSVEGRNYGTGGCGVNGDGQPYGHARLLVRGF